MAKKVKSVIALLKANGWVFVRMRGDHRVFKKKGSRYNISVPGDLNQHLAVGTQRSILRLAGLTGADLSEF